MSIVEKEILEAEVRIAGVTVSPVSVTLVYEGQDSRNVKRSFVQQVPVRDASLAARVSSDLKRGDQAQVTVINEWREDGCDTYLIDFVKKIETNEEPATTQKEPDATNRYSSFSHNEVRQVVTQPERAIKAKSKA